MNIAEKIMLLKALDKLSSGDPVAVIIYHTARKMNGQIAFEIMKREITRRTKTKIIVRGPNIPEDHNTQEGFTEFKENGSEWGSTTKPYQPYTARIEAWDDSRHLPMFESMHQRRQRDQLWKQLTRERLDWLPQELKTISPK